MFICYHDDLDGKCSAFLVKNLYRFNLQEGERKIFVPMCYGMATPLSDIHKDELVFIVDFSIPLSEMVRLLEITSNIVWIDHHATALDKYDSLPVKIKGYRKVGESGALLVYKYLLWLTNRGNLATRGFFTENTVDGVFDMRDVPTTMPTAYASLEANSMNVPYYIKLINDYDTWAFKYSGTRDFVAGFGSYDIGPNSDEWQSLVSYGVDRYIPAGKHINRNTKQKAVNYLGSFGHEVYFEGITFFAANIGMENSSLFEAANLRGVYDAVMTYVFNGSDWTVSMYSFVDAVVVSAIAKKFGGGGHDKAAGFVCKELPWHKV